jgi:hypothetical protein
MCPCSMLLRHKITIYIIQNLITINIAMIVRRWNRFWVVIISLGQNRHTTKLFQMFDVLVVADARVLL